jgi:NADH-quinone oxidoreductase subunit C
MLPDTLKEAPVAAAMEARNGAWIATGNRDLGELTLEVDAAHIVAICRFLKDDLKFNRLSSVTAVDRYPQEPRFEIVYHLHSLARSERVRLKAPISSGEETLPEIDSVCSVWRGADWYEREVFDLFGVRFSNHPDLRRIMMPDDWEGYPLRKDYPVHGHKYDYQNE